MTTVIMSKTGYSCIRRWLCFINLFFWIIGWCLLSIGIWLRTSFETYKNILPSYHILSADNLLLMMAFIMIVIAFTGCCGAWFQSKCLLSVFSMLIIMVMLIQIIIGVFGFVFRDSLHRTLKNELNDGLKNHYRLIPMKNNYTAELDYNFDENGMVRTWDHLQVKFNCCGVDSYRDWHNINAWKQNSFVPKSCCLSTSIYELNDDDDDDQPARNTSLNADVCYTPYVNLINYKIKTNGCYVKIHHWLLEHLHIISVVCIVFAFIQFFAIVTSLLIIFTMDYKRVNRSSTSNIQRSTYNRVQTL